MASESIDHSTSLAVSERRKLIKSLRRLDMVLFLVCALVGLDTLGQVAGLWRADVHLGRRARGACSCCRTDW